MSCQSSLYCVYPPVEQYSTLHAHDDNGQHAKEHSNHQHALCSAVVHGPWPPLFLEGCRDARKTWTLCGLRHTAKPFEIDMASAPSVEALKSTERIVHTCSPVHR